MSEIKVADISHDQRLLVHEEAASTQSLSEKRRLASLDIFRGLTVAVSSFFSLYYYSSEIFELKKNFYFY